MEIWIEKELFQWEKDRFVYINTTPSEPEIKLIQFYNKKTKVSQDVVLKGNQARIPNSLLKESLPIMVLACTGDGDRTQVISRREFRVLNRAKPENYIEDETEDDSGSSFPDGAKEVIYDGGEEV